MKEKIWYCPNCKKTMRFSRPAMGVVGYATFGRVYKCWKCGVEVYKTKERRN